ncbi:LuxR C-terminal-related transcriptional regulator [Sphingobacterium sp.]|uniref:LuxR C-terminal-related transcriptional regulator n=1 Tax=Sphingobacterium sp. TaxID=341027 RepID=UPI0031D7B081
MKTDFNAPFYLEVRKYWKTVAQQGKTIDPLTLHQQLEVYRKLFNIFQAGDYYFLLFDIYNGDIAEAGPEMSAMLGYSPEEMDLRLFMDSIHPADMPYFMNFEQYITSFLNTVPMEKITHYKFQYDLRIKKKDGNYLRILLQYVIIDYDENNLYHSLHVHTDITHLQKRGKPTCSIIGLYGEPSLYNIPDAIAVSVGTKLFTERETEVLKGIVEGMNSQEIADRLYLSIHTINTHRKNILVKAGVKTPLQLIKKTIEEGWV